MGTRANIARKNADGSFDEIYTHWDGYPEHHAPILLENYSTPEQVDALLALGDLSSLDKDLGTKHDFDKAPDGQCNAYGRDRGETGTEARHHADGEKFAEVLKKAWTEWLYVFVLSEGKWYFTNNPSPTWFKGCGSKQREMERLENWKQALETTK